MRRILGLALVVLVAIACGDTGDDRELAVTVTMDAFTDSACSGTFVVHDLAHTTAPRGTVMAMVDGTGAGVFTDDVDGDGRIDLILPNLSGDTAVWFNEGDLEFEPVVVASGRFRQAAAADLDGDGIRDIALSTGVGPLQAYLADGPRGPWVRTELPDLRLVTYSFAVGDLEGDGDLDVATGSYNAELSAVRDMRVLTGTDVGSGVYRPAGAPGELTHDEEFLTERAQALVTMIVDIDGDGTEDVVAGNDLGTPDRVWLGGPLGLTLTQLFDATTLSTMSIDIADVDNDGDRDLVATDMMPMPSESLDDWDGVLDDIEAARVDEIQIPQNVLQLSDGDRYTDVGVEVGVEATGWSWSGVFGDLDHDGLLDLYIVNGMQAEGIFDQLPDAELVEPNQVFRNTNEGFEPMPAWNLADPRGGRGMAQADLDGDGDLDIVVNNLGTPSAVYENQLCGGDSLIIDPQWSAEQNLDALGTTVFVTSGDTTYERIITGARGYLSTSATEAHVGVGSAGTTVDVEIRWPDGERTTLSNVAVGQRVVVDRTAPASQEPS